MGGGRVGEERGGGERKAWEERGGDEGESGKWGRMRVDKGDERRYNKEECVHFHIW